MSRTKNTSRGVRYYLCHQGSHFLQYLEERSIVENNLDRLTKALAQLLTHELSSDKTCKLFWRGIRHALAGCPKDEHFRVYENILAYGFVHLLDRYLRVWDIMITLIEHHVLPVPKRKLAILDIGSGPAPALYAAGDFYRELGDFAVAHSIERLEVPRLTLEPIELDNSMRHFFHLLSEYSRQGPSGALLHDFSQFDPQEFRKKDQVFEERLFEEGESWSFWERSGEIRAWADSLFRYQLVFLSNFLTAPAIVARFRRQIDLVFSNQRPGGIVVVLGGIGSDYPAIYEEVDAIANRSGHRCIQTIPEVFDDSFRQPYFPKLKMFNDTVWNHISEATASPLLNRKGYPPYWDSAAPIKSLKSFGVRVYRK